MLADKVNARLHCTEKQQRLYAFSAKIELLLAQKHGNGEREQSDIKAIAHQNKGRGALLPDGGRKEAQTPENLRDDRGGDRL